MVKDHTQTSTELKAQSSCFRRRRLGDLADGAQQRVSKTNRQTERRTCGLQERIRFLPGERAQKRGLAFRALCQGGDNAKLKDWVQKTLLHFQHHLEMATNMLDQKK
jgi:hypothetical protein